MSTIPCVRLAFCAADESLLMTSNSVLKLTSACVTTRSTWLSIGERIRVIDAGYIGTTHRFDVFDARVAESTHARPEQRAGNLG